jgi:hypothetical protein
MLIFLKKFLDNKGSAKNRLQKPLLASWQGVANEFRIFQIFEFIENLDLFAEKIKKFAFATT